jgi:hypothetical protein
MAKTMQTIKIFSYFLILVIVVGCTTNHTSTQTTDKPAIHGMLIVGEKTVSLSHLPMFHSPHNYQVILEATFRANNSNPQQIYTQDRARTKTKTYTLAPHKLFILPEVIADKRSFTADIYRGHFERGGKLIAKNVTVDIQKIIYFRKFTPEKGRSKTLQYILFGKGSEKFLAHLITAPPDFDQVLAVQSKPSKNGSLLTLLGRSNTQQLHTGEKVTANNNLPLVVGTEFYYETGDLGNY